MSVVDLALRGGGAGAGAVGLALELVAVAFGGGERGAQGGELVFQIGLAGLLHRQQAGELGDLRVELLQRGVLAGDFLLQIELHHDEHGQNEDDRQDQRRQRVDEARPIVHAGFTAAGACERHGLTVHVLAHHDLQEPLDLALLLGLAVDPVADHLLLGAHVVHQALDGLGQIRHGGGGGL